MATHESPRRPPARASQSDRTTWSALERQSARREALDRRWQDQVDRQKKIINRLLAENEALKNRLSKYEEI